MAFTSNQDVTLRYECDGDGEGLVLLHELGGSLDSWNGVVSALPRGFRVLRYDQRGAGMSEKVRQPFTLSHQVLDLDTVVSVAAMPASFWVAGVAAGAAIALAYAAEHPDRVKGLILCCPALGADKARTAYLEMRSDLASQQGIRAVIDETLSRSYPERVIRDRATYEEYRARFLANDPIGYGLLSRVLMESNPESILRDISCPCLVLAGEHDSLRPPEAIRRIADQLETAQFDILDSGHLMHVQAPFCLAQRMIEFTQAGQSPSTISVSTHDSPSLDFEHFAQVCRLKFHCRVEGPAGAPWIVFSNSLATDLSLWDAQVRALADRYRILRYDQRGHGRTEIPTGSFSFDDLSDDAAALLRHFGVVDAVFIGVSMGAVTALRLAHRCPSPLRGVVACDCQLSTPPNAAELWAQRIELAQIHGMGALVEPTLQRWFRPESLAARPPSIKAVARMIRRTPVEGFVANARVLEQRYDYRDDCATIRLPLLLLAGRQDGIIPEAMWALHQTIPGSTFVGIENAGHLPNVERPNEVNTALEQFLATLHTFK